MEKKFIEYFEKVAGGRPHRKTQSVEKSKSDQNICLFFYCEVSYLLGLNIFLNIAKKLQSGSHFGHLNKGVFS